MSGRINRVNDALANSTISLVESIEPLAGAVSEFAEGGKEAGTAFKYGMQGSALFMKDWRDAQEDVNAVRKFERANSLEERMRAAALNKAAIDALPTV